MRIILLAIAITFSINFAWADRCEILSEPTCSATGTSTAIVARDKNRDCLIYENTGTANIVLKFTGAHSGTEGPVIAPGQKWEANNGIINAVYHKAVTGTQSCYIGVGTFIDKTSH